MTRNERLLERARETLLAARSALPTAEEVDRVETLAADAGTRGHLTPNEEAEIRFLVRRYLHVRAALHVTLQSLKPMVPRIRTPKSEESVRAFLCAWLCGCMLMRAARFLIERYAGDPLIWKALNQADPTGGIPKGLFDEIRASSTRPLILVRYFQAMQYAEVLAPRLETLRSDDTWKPLVQALDDEKPFLEIQKRVHASSLAATEFQRWKNRPVRAYRRVMFGLFEASGRAIAEMRNPLHRKRIRRAVRHELAELIEPGDILITRHDDATSNLFLPGFWPHSAFVIGTSKERAHLQVAYREGQEVRSRDPICIVEAKKDGVRFRSLRETLEVDACLLLRPAYPSDASRKQAVERALSHEGKLYDFEFDFTRSDRLVCTEVIYRALDGVENFHFDLIRKSGRITLPAEVLLTQALDSGLFRVVAVSGIQGNLLQTGKRAQDLVIRSLNRS